MWTYDRKVRLARSAAILMLGLGAGCSDDDTDNDQVVEEAGGDGVPADGASEDGASEDGAAEDGASEDGASEDGASEDGDHGLDGGSESDAGSEDGGVAPSPFPTLPSVLSISGCNTLGLGPLCSVTQDEGAISAHCSGRTLSGTVSETGTLSLALPAWTTETGATADLTCTGRYISGRVTAACTQTTSAVGDSAGGEVSCNMASDPVVLPGVTCKALPSQVDDFVVCAEGVAPEGKIEAGACNIIQDACNFQAECANGTTFTGTVSRTGIAFTQKLTARADAQTPSTGSPAFVAGDVVNHSCTATLDGTAITGSCGAGAAGRGGVHTSVCAISGAQEVQPACAALSPAAEHLFVLDSCEQLRDGGNGEPGIGQPVCAFRQNNCIWEVNCSNNPLTTFSGRVQPGATKIEWRLLTGTPCEASFDAAGKLTGKCTVPGEEACGLTSIAPVVPEGVVDIPLEETFYSRGCGGGDPLDCRVALQHGANFMAVCGFSARYPDLVFAGKASLVEARPHLEFNGVGEYSCYVDKATDAEIASGDRKASEWYGQCSTPAGGMCRNNWTPTNPTGYRGLQLFFEAHP